MPFSASLNVKVIAKIAFVFRHRTNKNTYAAIGSNTPTQKDDTQLEFAAAYSLLSSVRVRLTSIFVEVAILTSVASNIEQFASSAKK